MKNLITFLICLLSVTVFAANPTYNSFVPGDFTNNGNTIGLNPASPKFAGTNGVNTNANYVWTGINEFNNITVKGGNVMTNLPYVFLESTNSFRYKGISHSFSTSHDMLVNLSTNSIWVENTNGPNKPMAGGTIQLGPYDYYFHTNLIFHPVTNLWPCAFSLVGSGPYLSRLIYDGPTNVPQEGLVLFNFSSVANPDLNTYTNTPQRLGNFYSSGVGFFMPDMSNTMLAVYSPFQSTIEKYQGGISDILTNDVNFNGVMQTGDSSINNGHHNTLFRVTSGGDGGISFYDGNIMGAKFGIKVYCDHFTVRDVKIGGIRGDGTFTSSNVTAHALMTYSNCAAVWDGSVIETDAQNVYSVNCDMGYVLGDALSEAGLNPVRTFSHVMSEQAGANGFVILDSPAEYVSRGVAEHISIINCPSVVGDLAGICTADPMMTAGWYFSPGITSSGWGSFRSNITSYADILMPNNSYVYGNLSGSVTATPTNNVLYSIKTNYFALVNTNEIWTSPFPTNTIAISDTRWTNALPFRWNSTIRMTNSDCAATYVVGAYTNSLGCYFYLDPNNGWIGVTNTGQSCVGTAFATYNNVTPFPGQQQADIHNGTGDLALSYGTNLVLSGYTYAIGSEFTAVVYLSNAVPEYVANLLPNKAYAIFNSTNGEALSAAYNSNGVIYYKDIWRP